MNGQEPRQNGNPTGAMPQQRNNMGQIPSRNLSAILDENNTVVCYLEPLSKWKGITRSDPNENWWKADIIW